MNDGDKDPPSTLALFNTILQTAENEFLQSTSAIHNNSSTEPSIIQQQQARAKLFYIATQLAKLNLQDELNSIQNQCRLWELILHFMIKYPDYALFKIVIPATSTPQQLNTRPNGNNTAAEEEEGQETTEEMSIWLLPRLLRCMILSKDSSINALETNIGNYLGNKNTREQVQENKKSAGGSQQSILEKGENWIKELLSNHLRLFYHHEEGGLAKRRELVRVLIKLAQGEH